MILGDATDQDSQGEATGDTATLDTLLTRGARNWPDQIALVDPPDRDTFTDGPARHLTYAEADRAVSTLAARLQSFGLPVDSLVAYQLANTIESVIVPLAIMRAGMIAAPLPLLWRRNDAVNALTLVGAKALITARHVSGFDHAELARQVAADVFPVRVVAGFGRDLPEGVTPLNDIFEAAPAKPVTVERSGNPAEHVALVTFDVTVKGLVPAARSHKALIAAGRSLGTETGIGIRSNILGAMTTSSFVGLTATMLAWLTCGGTLFLHQPFSPDTFALQRGELGCDVVVVPGPLVPRLRDAGLLSDDLRSVIAVWRAPERAAAAPTWASDAASLIDVLGFGEIGFVAARRTDGSSTQLALGAVGHADAMPVVAVGRSEAGTLTLRGSMVPQYNFLTGAEPDDRTHLKIAADGFVDTDYPCRLGGDGRTISLSGPPPGLISVGGYRFAVSAVQELVARKESGGAVATLPDSVFGHRLGGVTADRARLRRILAEQGVNPLLVAAFRDRRATTDQASAA